MGITFVVLVLFNVHVKYRNNSNYLRNNSNYLRRFFASRIWMRELIGINLHVLVTEKGSTRNVGGFARSVGIYKVELRFRVYFTCITFYMSDAMTIVASFRGLDYTLEQDHVFEPVIHE